MNILSSKITVSFALILLECGCVGVRTFPTIKPVTFEPSLIQPGKPVVVDSLTPLFKWKQEDPHYRADFAIWRITENSSATLFLERDGILGSQYRLENALTPDAEYIWSVRITGSHQWARMNYTQGMVIPTPVVAFGEWSHRTGLPFRIRAPKSEINSGTKRAPNQLTDPTSQSVTPAVGLAGAPPVDPGH